MTCGTKEPGICGHDRVLATSLAIGVVNLKDVHDRVP
jgi:hypothetical protein